LQFTSSAGHFLSSIFVFIEGPDPMANRMLEETVSKLAASLRGSVITPASNEYEAARKVYSGMIDPHPDAIARCANVADKAI
jgi:hypothetical protein